MVLVNQQTASAAEIVAACLQDHKRATIVGERTFGKGTVQNVKPLEGGRSLLKLTTASYWRPSGQDIHRHHDAKDQENWGVQPDAGHEVKLTEQEGEELNRRRHAKDVVRSDATPPSQPGEPRAGQPIAGGPSIGKGARSTAGSAGQVGASLQKRRLQACKNVSRRPGAKAPQNPSRVGSRQPPRGGVFAPIAQGLPLRSFPLAGGLVHPDEDDWSDPIRWPVPPRDRRASRPACVFCFNMHVPMSLQLLP